MKRAAEFIPAVAWKRVRPVVILHPSSLVPGGLSAVSDSCVMRARPLCPFDIDIWRCVTQVVSPQ